MNEINACNVNDAVNLGLSYLLEHGIEEDSRNGKVLVAPGPVMTIYSNPKEHVLFSPTRDANPFFHLMEALWMLNGDNDLAFPMMFNKRFKEYSDDGSRIWGAYGWRWRKFFGSDQISRICAELSDNKKSRRCVLSMWNGMPNNHDMWEGQDDLFVATNGGRDVPCNTHAYFDVRGGFLNMTVCNRSNDAIWGAYGANAVHFSILQEYMAEKIGVTVGLYRQFSNNFHAYLDVYSREKLAKIAAEGHRYDHYSKVFDTVPTIPLGANNMYWDSDLRSFIADRKVQWESKNFFSQVAGPMYDAWQEHKAGGTENALIHIRSMPFCDWRIACEAWLLRRSKGADNAA